MIELNQTKKVSVIIATFNHEKYIRDALESVYANSQFLMANNRHHVSIEIIVIDDGSTDRTKEVVEEFSQKYGKELIVKYIYQKNQGQSAAYENSLDHIEGEIVFLLDSDDIFLPEKMELVLTVFENNPEVGMVGHPLYVINSSGQRTGEIKPKAAKLSHGDIRGIVSKYGRNVAPATSGLAFRYDLFKEVHPNPLKKYSSAADSYLTFAASLTRPVYAMEEVLAEYRQHSGSQYLKRMISVDGLKRTIEIQKNIVSHFGLGHILEKNSYFSRNIFALSRMTEPMNRWISNLTKLNRAIYLDPFLPMNKKVILSTYWNVTAFLPKKLFWKYWVLFQKIQTGYKDDVKNGG